MTARIATLHVADIFTYRNVDTKSGAVTTKLRMFGDELNYPSGVGVGPKHVVLASLSSDTVQTGRPQDGRNRRRCCTNSKRRRTRRRRATGAFWCSKRGRAR